MNSMFNKNYINSYIFNANFLEINNFNKAISYTLPYVDDEDKDINIEDNNITSEWITLATLVKTDYNLFKHINEYFINYNRMRTQNALYIKYSAVMTTFLEKMREREVLLDKEDAFWERVKKNMQKRDYHMQKQNLFSLGKKELESYENYCKEFSNIIPTMVEDLANRETLLEEVQEKENLLIKEQEIIKEKKTAIKLQYDDLNLSQLNLNIEAEKAIDIALHKFFSLELEKKKNLVDYEILHRFPFSSQYLKSIPISLKAGLLLALNGNLRYNNMDEYLFTKINF
jgi:hypothetical protein